MKMFCLKNGLVDIQKDYAVNAGLRKASPAYGTAQSLTIDVRGQNVTRAQLKQMLTNIERKSGGAITRDNINILH